LPWAATLPFEPEAVGLRSSTSSSSSLLSVRSMGVAFAAAMDGFVCRCWMCIELDDPGCG
jgi:hypothetical protein